jgi:hypothetical protein
MLRSALSLTPGLRRAAVPAAIAAAVGGAVAVASAFDGTQQMRFEGEHGLAVHVEGDSVVVRWLTRAAQPGHVEVLGGERAIDSSSTPLGFAHRAAFAIPHGERNLLLRYGGTLEGVTRYETRVLLDPPARPPVVFEAVDSVFVLGDTHGMYDELMTGLHRAELVDSAGRWIGGRRHLVLAGDLMDRGPDVAGLLWTVYRLEREAERAGGRVHVLLGNHELMVMMGDLRYVNPKELHLAELHGQQYDRLYDMRTSILGRWLATKPAAISIGVTVIVHGGLSAAHARSGLRALDDSLRLFMAEDLFYRWADSTAIIPIDSMALERRTEFLVGSGSLFWHRAYVQSDTMGAELDESLAAVDGAVLVVGHTPVDSIHERYDGRLIPAHTPRFGAELLLLVRDGDRYRRYRVTDRGTEPIPGTLH